jgi:hypothetical protein
VFLLLRPWHEGLRMQTLNILKWSMVGLSGLSATDSMAVPLTGMLHAYAS